MNEEKLDLTTFNRAIASLDVALQEYQKSDTNLFVRDSCIQRFEYCYGIATKMMKRYLSFIAEDPIEIDEMSFPALVRTAYSKGLLRSSWDQWSVYRKARNVTSHAYSEEKALEVLSVLDDFYQELIYFVTALENVDET